MQSKVSAIERWREKSRRKKDIPDTEKACASECDRGHSTLANLDYGKEKRKQCHVGCIKACQEPCVRVCVCVSGVLAGDSWRSGFVRFAFQTRQYDHRVQNGWKSIGRNAHGKLASNGWEDGCLNQGIAAY